MEGSTSLSAIVQINMPTSSHFVKILCITINISPQQTKIIKSGPSVSVSDLSHLHEIRA